MKEGKIIILSAPSGCGKSTIINALLDRGQIDMQFSVSATSRPPRQGETNGVNYWFLTEDEFRDRIAAGDFIEYEEVYRGRFYGTLRSEIDRITGIGHNIVLDIDVKGAMNVKKLYGERALTLFILPPSVETLRQRLYSRATDTPEAIEERLAKAESELQYAPLYDARIVNDDLPTAVNDTELTLKEFLAR